MKTREIGIASWSSVRFWKTTAVLFAVTASLILPLRAQPAPPVEKVDKAVETALLAEDWRKVAHLLNSVTPKSQSLVLRIIKGHACLALNQNDQAVILYLSANKDIDLKAYKTWVDDLRGRKPTSPATEYLYGDACARLQSWEPAIASFNKCLEMEPANIMALNARGICFAIENKWDAAIDDFAAANKIAPSFADPWANRGAMYIQRSKAAKGSLTSFRTAQTKSQSIALAKMGEACALFGAGKWDEAEKLLKAMQAPPEIMDLTRLNLKYIQWIVLDQSKNKLASADHSAGASFNLSTSDQQLQQMQNTLGNSIKYSSQAAVADNWANTLDKSKWGTAVVGGGVTIATAELPFVSASVGVGTGLAMTKLGDMESASQRNADSFRNLSDQSYAQFSRQVSTFCMDSAHDLMQQQSTKSPMQSLNNQQALVNVTAIMSTMQQTRDQNQQQMSQMKQQFNSPISSPSFNNTPPGGVTMDLSREYVDKGNWGVYMPYGTLYPSGRPLTDGKK